MTGNCPRCRRALDAVSTPGATTFRCTQCAGCVVTVGALRQFAPRERVDAAWRETWADAPATGAACPFCARPMRTVTLDGASAPLVLDACRGCEAIWFDAGELAAFSPERQSAPERRHVVSDDDARRAIADVVAGAEAVHGPEKHRAGFDRGPGAPAEVPWIVRALSRALAPRT